MSSHVLEVEWESQVVKNEEKHAQSMYLDEYVWIKKNLVEKCCLAAKICEFPSRGFFLVMLVTLPLST